MLAMCVESIVQKIQQQGVLVFFEKHGPDPHSVNGIFLLFSCVIFNVK